MGCPLWSKKLDGNQSSANNSKESIILNNSNEI